MKIFLKNLYLIDKPIKSLGTIFKSESSILWMALSKA